MASGSEIELVPISLTDGRPRKDIYQPAGYILPRTYRSLHKRMLELRLRNDDVWVVTHPKCGNNKYCFNSVRTKRVANIRSFSILILCAKLETTCTETTCNFDRYDVDIGNGVVIATWSGLRSGEGETWWTSTVYRVSFKEEIKVQETISPNFIWVAKIVILNCEHCQSWGSCAITLGNVLISKLSFL